MKVESKKEKYKEATIRNIIEKELESLNYNFEYIGTRYIADAIYLLYSLKMYYKFSLESDVYPAIANMYGDNSNAIKGTITYATDKMFFDCDERILKKYLDDKNNRVSKPGPKTIIRAVLKKIKNYPD